MYSIPIKSLFIRKQYSLNVFLFVFFLLTNTIAKAQKTIKYEGIVVSETGIPVPNTIVHIKEKNTTVYSDNNGKFSLSLTSGKSYTVVFNCIGYSAYQTSIDVTDAKADIFKVVLNSNTSMLDSVNITSSSAISKARQQAYQVTVVDAKRLHNTTMNIAQALNNVPGIRVRETGGLGSNIDFSLNGFTGNQVKFFIDGIPMENMGNAFRINNIPINLAERIEVYKGVVPVELGADALGGAINIVTNSGRTSYLDASYSYGSFNTHKTTLNMAINDKSGFTFMLNGFQNYSDNSYWVKTETPINQYGQVEMVKTKRFHDRYHNEMLMLGVGVRNKKWADQLIFGLDLGQYRKDLQTGVTMQDVYGKRKAQGVTILPSIKYLKRNFLTKGLTFNLSGNYNLGYDRTIDTANVQYNWLGQVIRSSSSKGGERNRMDSKYRNHDGVFTANLSYIINDQHSFVVNDNYTTFRRVTKDLLGAENDQFANRPSTVGKNVFGVSYRYDHSSKWNISAFGKLYSQTSKAFVNKDGTDNPTHDDYSWAKNTFDAKGYGVAGTYFVSRVLQTRVSFEHGIRVPTSEELFGNMNTLTENITLKPESSDNYNVGIIYSPNINNVHFFTFDAGFLYRNSKDFIRPSLTRSMKYTIQKMVNTRDVDNKGLEASIRYRYKNQINIGGNISYQNLRNQTKYESGSSKGIVSIVYKDRIPNMPYFFGNADASYTINKPFGSDGSLTIGYQLMYVHAYFEGWPSLGMQSQKITIPTQWNHNANLIYTFKGGKYNVTVECINLTDALLYDHFNLQKPSRAFNFKLRYFLFNTK